MIFKGEISKLNALDLLMFLINFGKEGLLTVTRENQSFRIAIKDGAFVDAHSDPADEKILWELTYKKMIDKDRFKYIRQVKRETKMPVRQILENLDLFPLSKVRKVLENGIKETLFQILICKTGQFHFADILADQDTANVSLDCQRMALEMATWVDEWNNMVQSINSLDLVLTKTSSGKQSKGLDDIERIVLNLVDGKRTIQQVISYTPFPSYIALKIVYKFITDESLVSRARDQKTSPTDVTADSESLFVAFKETFKKILQNKGIKLRMSKLIDFCRIHFDYTLIIKAKDYRMIHCILFYRDTLGQIRRKEIKNLRSRIDEDPVFLWVYDSGMVFLGKVFSTNLNRDVKDLPTAGECGVMLINKQKRLATLVYVASSREDGGINPFHYLELLSWLINSPKEISQLELTPQKRAASPSSQEPSPKSVPSDISRAKLELLIKNIDDLPPMPHNITQIHALLSDPNSSMSDLTPVLSQDQSLVIEILKVSNSVLYGGNQEITNLKLALTRLGGKTILSIVVTASTRSYFAIRKGAIGSLSRPLWQHSKESALAARRVAEKVRYHDPEEAFVGGLLHDIGKLVLLLGLPKDYDSIRKRLISSKMISIDAEKEVLGFDHTKIGSLLMRKWKMPEPLKTCVQYHHQLQGTHEPDMLSYVVAYGDLLSHLHGFQTEESQAEKTVNLDHILEHLKLSDRAIGRLTELVIKDFQSADIFG